MSIPPRNMALAYRIWAYCTPREWDCLAAEVAEALDADVKSVASICRARGWNQRMRTSKIGFDPTISNSNATVTIDAALREMETK